MTDEAQVREDGARWLRVSEGHQQAEMRWIWLCQPEGTSGEAYKTTCDADGWIDASDVSLREPPDELFIVVQLKDGSRHTGSADSFVWDSVAAWAPAMPFYDRLAAREQSQVEKPSKQEVRDVRS